MKLLMVTDCDNLKVTHRVGIRTLTHIHPLQYANGLPISLVRRVPHAWHRSYLCFPLMPWSLATNSQTLYLTIGLLSSCHPLKLIGATFAQAFRFTRGPGRKAGKLG